MSEFALRGVFLRLGIAGKWMHDFVAENRFESDWGMLTLGWNF